MTNAVPDQNVLSE